MVNRIEGATRVTRLFLLAKRLSPANTFPRRRFVSDLVLLVRFKGPVLWSFFSFSIPGLLMTIVKIPHDAFLVLLLRGFLLRRKVTYLFASGWRATLRVEIIFYRFRRVAVFIPISFILYCSSLHRGFLRANTRGGKHTRGLEMVRIGVAPLLPRSAASISPSARLTLLIGQSIRYPRVSF